MNLSNKKLKVVIDGSKLKQDRFVLWKRIIIKNSTYLKKFKMCLQYNLDWNFIDSIKIKCKRINNKFLYIMPFPIPKIVKC